MTRSLTLTPVQWAAVQAGGWLVRRGGLQYVREAEVFGGPPLAPPALVAAAAPCETCGGRRWHPATSADEPGAACTHCRITLLGECPHCEGQGGATAASTSGYLRGGRIRYGGAGGMTMTAVDCQECRGTGAVTLGHAYAVGEVLPVLSDRGWFAVDLADNVIVVMDRRAFRVPTLAESSEEITDALAPYGDPATLVGQYALRLEVQP